MTQNTVRAANSGSREPDPSFTAGSGPSGFDPGRKTLDQMMEEAMGPRKNPRQSIFRDHNCWKCREGALPCPNNYHNCEYPHARND